MNITRPFLLSLALLSFLPLQSVAMAESREGRADRASQAQHHGRGDKDPSRMLRRIERVLDLDELQAQNIRNLVLAAQPELDALRDATRENRRAMRALSTDSRDYADRLAEAADEKGRLTSRKIQLLGKLRADINAELTEEQRAELKSAMDRRAGYRQGRRSERRKHRRTAH